MFKRSGVETVGQFARQYATFRDVEPESVRQLVIAADLFERWAGAAVPLAELDERSVSEWLRDLAGTRAPATVRSKRQLLLSLWRLAADEDLCEPPRRRVRSARVIPQPVECWTLEEVRAIVAACQQAKRWHPCGLRRAVWWELAVRVAWDTALRRGDQLRLPVSAFGPDGSGWIVQHKTRRPLAIRLGVETAELLRESLAEAPRDLVTPWPASGEAFAQQFRRLVQAAGVRPGTWKWLRRASITDCEAQQAGAGGPQGGHAPGSRVTAIHYLSQAILRGPDPVRPRAL